MNKNSDQNAFFINLLDLAHLEIMPGLDYLIHLAKIHVQVYSNPENSKRVLSTDELNKILGKTVDLFAHKNPCVRKEAHLLAFEIISKDLGLASHELLIRFAKLAQDKRADPELREWAVHIINRYVSVKGLASSPNELTKMHEEGGRILKNKTGRKKPSAFVKKLKIMLEKDAKATILHPTLPLTPASGFNASMLTLTRGTNNNDAGFRILSARKRIC